MSADPLKIFVVIVLALAFPQLAFVTIVLMALAVALKAHFQKMSR